MYWQCVHKKIDKTKYKVICDVTKTSCRYVGRAQYECKDSDLHVPVSKSNYETKLAKKRKR